MEDNRKNIAVCLINHEPLYNRRIYPLAIGCLDYDVFKRSWNEKFKDEKSENQFFKELEEWGIYHSPSENLIVLKPEDIQLKRKITTLFYNFKSMFKKSDKVLKYLNDIQVKEDKDLFKKALVFLLRDRLVRLNSSELSFLKTSEEELKDILSRFVAKYGLSTYDGHGGYKLSDFINQNDINNFLCPHSGLDLMKFIKSLPKEELDAFNVIFEDQQRWEKLLDKVRPIREKRIKVIGEKGVDNKEVKELESEEKIINEEMRKIEEKSKEKLGTPANGRFFTHARKIAKILKISEERCNNTILNLKMKGLFSTPKYSSRGLDWVEIPWNVFHKLFKQMVKFEKRSNY